MKNGTKKFNTMQRARFLVAKNAKKQTSNIMIPVLTSTLGRKSCKCLVRKKSARKEHIMTYWIPNNGNIVKNKKMESLIKMDPLSSTLEKKGS